MNLAQALKEHALEHALEQRLRSGLSFSFRSCYGCWPRVIGFDRAACEILLFCFHVFYSLPDTPLAHQRIARALDRWVARFPDRLVAGRRTKEEEGRRRKDICLYFMFQNYFPFMMTQVSPPLMITKNIFVPSWLQKCVVCSFLIAKGFFVHSLPETQTVYD